MYRMKEITVKVCNIIEEMSHHMPKSFFGHYILLPALLAIAALHYRTAIQAILLFSLRDMRHYNFFLKISTKKYKKPFFFVTEQLR